MRKRILSPELYDHHIKISPKKAVTFYTSRFQEPHQRYQLNSRKKKDIFELTRHAKATMNNCFTWLRLISNKKKIYSKMEKKTFTFELSFITLTLSDTQQHSDDFIKSHMLSPFLKWMQRSWSVNSYIWKAEVQNNGNIHFHITTNKFIHWKSIRSKWNRLLSNYNYCKVMQDGSNDKGDAATNIKAVKNNNQIESYIANYCTKKDLFKMEYSSKTGRKQYLSSLAVTDKKHFYYSQNSRSCTCEDGHTRQYKRHIEGRLWNASYNLNQDALNITDKNSSYQALHKILTQDGVCTLIDLDFAKVYLFKKKVFNLLPAELQFGFRQTVNHLRRIDKVQTQLTIESIY